MVAVLGLSLLVGDSVLAMESVCGIVQSPCAGFAVLPDVGMVFALSLLGAVGFWGVLGGESLGMTHFAPWWVDWRRSLARRSRIVVDLATAGLFVLGVAVLVALATYREILSGHVIRTDADAAAVLDATASVRVLVMIGGGLLVGLSAAPALVHLVAWAGYASRWVAGALGWVVLSALSMLLALLGGAVTWLTETACTVVELLSRQSGPTGDGTSDHEAEIPPPGAFAPWDDPGLGGREEPWIRS
jgi:hypothetical protein